MNPGRKCVFKINSKNTRLLYGMWNVFKFNDKVIRRTLLFLCAMFGVDFDLVKIH